MKKKSIAVFALMILLAGSLARAETKTNTAPMAETAEKALKDSTRHGEWVDIPVGDSKVHTFVVYPERKEKAPVVIVIHEIFGMTDWVRAVADQLAAEGFIAVAPDLLSGKGPGGGGTESFKADAVRDAVGKLKDDEIVQRLDAVRAYATALPAASGKSASIGFCWGGAASFKYATQQMKLNAAVVYYGRAPEKDALAKIDCPVLGFYGENDARITSTVDDTKKTMAELKKSYTPHVFDGAAHGFLRQQSASDANRKAADAAWTETISFLKKNLE